MTVAEFTKTEWVLASNSRWHDIGNVSFLTTQSTFRSLQGYNSSQSHINTLTSITTNQKVLSAFHLLQGPFFLCVWRSWKRNRMPACFFETQTLGKLDIFRNTSGLYRLSSFSFGELTAYYWKKIICIQSPNPWLPVAMSPCVLRDPSNEWDKQNVTAGKIKKGTRLGSSWPRETLSVAQWHRGRWIGKWGGTGM